MSDNEIKLVKISIYEVNLPFVFSFGHNLANRKSTNNIIVKLDFQVGDRIVSGFGEAVPRDYVTNETTISCMEDLKNIYIPNLINFRSKNVASAKDGFANILDNISILGNTARCALELAFLDGLAKINNTNIINLMSNIDSYNINSINYGAVIPYLSINKFKALFKIYAWLGFKTIKIKLGRDFDHNINLLKLANSCNNSSLTIRADANQAWSVNDSVKHVNDLMKFNLASIEEPCKANFSDLKSIQDNIPIPLIVDESLVSYSDAQNLLTVCKGFNIRISKNGGLSNAIKIANLASQNNLECHLGAQVGETRILSKANQALAFILANEYKIKLANVEGAGNDLLLMNNLSKFSFVTLLPSKFGLDFEPGFGVNVNLAGIVKFSVNQFCQDLI